MKREIKGSVVVITGASSGIGRETALQFARRGAKLVLAARDPIALGEVLRGCQECGAQVIALTTDVSHQAEVDKLRQGAIERFGTIDVWVNDAAAYLMGRVDQVPSEAVRRLFDVNVMGVVHGTRAALQEFERRGRGVLINVGSVAGKVPYAQASAYCASKHAVHAFTEALRQELTGTDIHACIVAPGTVDTPLFQHAANYTGRQVEAMRPIYEPQRVAAAIVGCAERPRREVLIGAAPRVMSSLQLALPQPMERVQPKLIEAEHLGKPAQGSVGNLFGPIGPHAIDGGWRARKTSVARRPLQSLKRARASLRRGALRLVSLLASALRRSGLRPSPSAG